MRDELDDATLELPGLAPATLAPRARCGMVVWCDHVACRITTVMRGAQLVELRTLRDGTLIGIRPVADLVFQAQQTSMDFHRRPAGQSASSALRIAG